MHRATRITFSLLVLLFFLAGCAQPPSPHKPDQEKFLFAKRFVHSVGGGKMAMVGMQRKIEEEAQKSPGMAELFRRAFAETTEEDFERMVATVYSHHLSRDNLSELAHFSETPAGKHFFQLAFQRARSGTPITKHSIIRELNADELTEILKFSQSGAATALKLALPEINRELSEEGRRMGETVMRDYIKSH